jgi:hypothetical protein
MDPSKWLGALVNSIECDSASTRRCACTYEPLRVKKAETLGFCCVGYVPSMWGLISPAGALEGTQQLTLGAEVYMVWLHCVRRRKEGVLSLTAHFRLRQCGGIDFSGGKAGAAFG